MKVLCIYHGNCADGFGAAWVVRRALGEEQVEFVAGVYQTPPPDVVGRDVILVDFSYKRSVLEKMVSDAASMLILDHHKTAAADLEGLVGAEAVFDMGRSGARITWDYFFPGETPPPLLLHIEDRDLWRFSLPLTREIQANVFSHPYDFKVWDLLMGADLSLSAIEGRAIERKHFKDIDELVKVTGRRMVIAGHNVPVANLPYTFSSDAGHKMAQGEPFAACYYDTPAGRCFSLRSADNGLDVSEVAKKYGGGGHARAAGFTVPWVPASEIEVVA